METLATTDSVDAQSARDEHADPTAPRTNQANGWCDAAFHKTRAQLQPTSARSFGGTRRRHAVNAYLN